jgi:hypothetical protein
MAPRFALEVVDEHVARDLVTGFVIVPGIMLAAGADLELELHCGGRAVLVRARVASEGTGGTELEILGLDGDRRESLAAFLTPPIDPAHDEPADGFAAAFSPCQPPLAARSASRLALASPGGIRDPLWERPKGFDAIHDAPDLASKRGELDDSDRGDAIPARGTAAGDATGMCVSIGDMRIVFGARPDGGRAIGARPDPPGRPHDPEIGSMPDDPAHAIGSRPDHGLHPTHAVGSRPADGSTTAEALDPSDDPSASDASPADRRLAATVHERLRRLTIAEQIKTAQTGEVHERIVLERLYGKTVWEALLHNPRLTGPEVARIARMGTLPRVLLEVILGNGGWLQIPEVRRALLSSRRLGTDQILRVLRLLSKHELKLACVQTAYPPAVRDAARRLAREG